MSFGDWTPVFMNLAYSRANSRSRFSKNKEHGINIILSCQGISKFKLQEIQEKSQNDSFSYKFQFQA